MRKFITKALTVGVAFASGIGVGSVVTEKEVSSSTSLPKAYPVLHRSGYSLCYDGRNRIPLWVSETLTEGSLKGTESRKGLSFSEDPDIYSHHKSQLLDYKGSGFDRGHLSPAANHRASAQDLKESFLLSNVSPMVPNCNRGIWSQLEEHARKCTLHYDSVHVISGPLFVPLEKEDKNVMTYELIGTNHIAVPTHFFKIIQGKVGSRHVTEAYMVPNAPVTKVKGLSTFQVSVEEIEKLSGIEFPSSFHG